MLPERRDRPRVLLPLAVALLAASSTLVGGPAAGHGGVEDGHPDAPAPTGAANPNGAFALASAPGVLQEHPAVARDLVVWQQFMGGDRGWDLFGANITTLTTFTIIGQTGDQLRPDMDRSSIVWQDGEDGNADVAMLELETGRLRVLASSDASEFAPRISWPYAVWLERAGDGRTTVGAYDVEREAPVHLPVEVNKAVGVDTWGGHIVWAERAGATWRLFDWTEANGTVREVAHGTSAFAGPRAGPPGIVYIARVVTVLTHLVEWDAAAPRALDTSISPHANAQPCDGAVVWDQGATIEGAHGVAYWDLVVDTAYTFLEGNYRPDCTAHWIVYEKRLRPDTTNVYALPVEPNRPTLRPLVSADPGSRDRILRAPAELSGTIEVRDPRVPIVSVAGTLEGNEELVVAVEPVDATHFRWHTLVDPVGLSNGDHSISIIVTTARGLVVDGTVHFFVAVENAGLSQAIIENNLYKEPPPVKRGLWEALGHHYSTFAAFYNTLLIVLVILFLVGRWAYRRWKAKPIGKPEYVRTQQ